MFFSPFLLITLAMCLMVSLMFLESQLLFSWIFFIDFLFSVSVILALVFIISLPLLALNLSCKNLLLFFSFPEIEAWIFGFVLLFNIPCHFLLKSGHDLWGKKKMGLQ